MSARNSGTGCKNCRKINAVRQKPNGRDNFWGCCFALTAGSKLHFATCKSFDGKQDHYVCANYKSNWGSCSAHYIREEVLQELVLERIRAVNEYIQRDVEGFEEELLQCRKDDHEKSIQEDRKRLEQERLKLEIKTAEELVEQQEKMNDNADAFIRLTQKYIDVPELTQTIVNEYIRKIVVYAPDKSSGKRRQKIKIFFNFADDVSIPALADPIIAKPTYTRRKTA